MISLPIEYLPYKEITTQAQNFANKWNLEDKIPVPIEEIIEFGLKMDIIPTPNLRIDHDIEGFISSDFSGIRVDESIFNKVPNRYRFTLAHEIGHYILHKKIFKEHTFKSTEKWKNFITSADPNDYSKMEYQANCFAGLVLVPPHQLQSCFKNNLCKIFDLVKQAKSKNIGKADYLDYAITYMAEILSTDFDVSAEVVARRMVFDKLGNQIP